MNFVANHQSIIGGGYDQRAETRLQPAEVRRHRLWARGIRSHSGLAVGDGDVTIRRRARHDRHRPQRLARPRHQQRLHERTSLRPAIDLAQRRAHLEPRTAHVQVRRRVSQHRVAVPVPRQHRDHLQRHQRVHRQSAGAGRGGAGFAAVLAAAVLLDWVRPGYLATNRQPVAGNGSSLRLLLGRQGEEPAGAAVLRRGQRLRRREPR